MRAGATCEEGRPPGRPGAGRQSARQCWSPRSRSLRSRSLRGSSLRAGGGAERASSPAGGGEAGSSPPVVGRSENGLCYCVRHVRTTGRLLPQGENPTSVAPNSIWSLSDDGGSPLRPVGWVPNQVWDDKVALFWRLEVYTCFQHIAQHVLRVGSGDATKAPPRHAGHAGRVGH